MQKTLVKFMLVNSSELEINTYDYTENIVSDLYKRGLITQYISDGSYTNCTDDPTITEIVESIYIAEFIYHKHEEKTHWQLIFEFGTFTSSCQLQIKIKSDDYIIDVDNAYLEQLKYSIKDIVKSDWEEIIWLMDKDSELLSITLYPTIYKTENMARQLINEVMTKEYGIGWWDTYVPLNIRNKHKARLSGYKSITPGFANVDERLMSIDIGDLNTIFTLKVNKWNPSYNNEINNVLNNQSDYKSEKIKKLLLEQMEVTIDFWEEQFSKYLSEDYIDNFKTFELNRNHVVHNKLIDRAAYSSILTSINKVEEELIGALQKVEEKVVSNEQKNAFEEQMYFEMIQYEAAMRDIVESEAGINIRDSGEIINFYDKFLYELYLEIRDYLRFRSDLKVGEYKSLLSKEKTGPLFDITYKITSEVARINYLIVHIDDSQGGESTIEIIIELNENSESYPINYINGKAIFDSYQGNYLPEVQDTISTEDFELFKNSFIKFINKYFKNMREQIDSQIYSIIKDGGNSPVLDIPCSECDKEYICVDESYGVIGQCLNCGEMNEICVCERCGCYFEDELYEYDDVISICDNCKDYYKNQ